MTDPRLHTDRFRLGARTPVLLAALTAVMMALLIFAVLLGPGFDPKSSDPIWAAAGLAFLGGLLAAALWLAWRPP
jgi:hypothetical protein